MKINALIFYLCQLLWYWCYYLNMLRYTLSPVCGIFRAISNHRVWFRVALSHLDLSWFFVVPLLAHWKALFCYLCSTCFFLLFFWVFFGFNSLDSFTKSLLFDLLGVFWATSFPWGTFFWICAVTNKEKYIFLNIFRESLPYVFPDLYFIQFFALSIAVSGDSCWIEEEKGWKCFTLETYSAVSFIVSEILFLVKVEMYA